MYFTDPLNKTLLKSDEEFIGFFKGEMIFWNDLFSVIHNSAIDGRYEFKEVELKIEELKLTLDLPSELMSSTHELTKQFYSKYRLPLSEEFSSVFGLLIHDDEWLEEITVFLAVLINDKKIRIPGSRLIPFYIFGALCRSGADESSVDFLEERISNARKENNQSVAEFKTIFENLNSDLLNTRFEFSNLQQDFSTKKDEILNKYESDTNAIREAFESEIKLRSAVAYWTEKKNKHNEESRKIMQLLNKKGPFIVIAAIFLIFIVFLVSNKFGDSLIDKNFKYVVSAFTITMVIWVFRLAIKMWLSNIHLANDAEERVVLVQTYLALQKDNVMPSDDDKRVVVNSLFRQASDGVVRDDGMPNPIVEFITRK